MTTLKLESSITTFCAAKIARAIQGSQLDNSCFEVQGLLVGRRCLSTKKSAQELHSLTGGVVPSSSTWATDITRTVPPHQQWQQQIHICQGSIKLVHPQWSKAPFKVWSLKMSWSFMVPHGFIPSKLHLWYYGREKSIRRRSNWQVPAPNVHVIFGKGPSKALFWRTTCGNLWCLKVSHDHIGS